MPLSFGTGISFGQMNVNITNDPGIPNKSIYFPANSSLRGPSAAAFNVGTGDFTFEFWYYATTFANTGDHNDLAFDNGTWQTGISGTSLNFEKYGSGWNYFVIPNAAITNSWTHVAVVRSSGTLSGYINGTRQLTGTKTDNLNGSYNFTINGRGQYANTGKDAMLYNNIRMVLGTAVYSGTSFTVPTSSLTAISGTSLLCGQGPDPLVDKSSNSYTLTY